MLLDGKKVSAEIKLEVKEEVESFLKKGLPQPGLAVIIVGEDKASQIYVGSKTRSCAEAGIKSEHIKFPENTTEEDLIKEVERLNNDDTIDAILVQMPLPKHINSSAVIEKISPKKDVDCFTSTNIGNVYLGVEDTVYPCTPFGIVQILKKYELSVEGKDVVVIGRSNIVGKPMALMLVNLGATVTICNSKTKDLKEKTKQAEILISCVGKKDFITEDMVMPGAIIIDVGINRVDGKIYGDVDFENVSKKASYITPVPGGVGVMTVAMLLKNCINLYKKNRGEK